MTYRAVSRADDEVVLRMIAMRQKASSYDVGATFGVTGERVRIITNRVREAGLRESGEPMRDVIAAYQWGRG